MKPDLIRWVWLFFLSCTLGLADSFRGGVEPRISLHL
jgi:hypothetical protein